jgi:hypothetical protein
VAGALANTSRPLPIPTEQRKRPQSAAQGNTAFRTFRALLGLALRMTDTSAFAHVARAPLPNDALDALIAITVEAFEAIARTLLLGIVAFENNTDEQGQRLIWLAPTVIDRIRAMRGPILANPQAR